MKKITKKFSMVPPPRKRRKKFQKNVLRGGDHTIIQSVPFNGNVRQKVAIFVESKQISQGCVQFFIKQEILDTSLHKKMSLNTWHVFRQLFHIFNVIYD